MKGKNILGDHHRWNGHPKGSWRPFLVPWDQPCKLRAPLSLIAGRGSVLAVNSSPLIVGFLKSYRTCTISWIFGGQGKTGLLECAY